MDNELHQHLSEIKSMLAVQGSQIETIRSGLQEHIDRDMVKFQDLYDKAGEAEQFRSTVKGYTKGAAAVMAVLSLSTGLIMKVKGLF